jgi:hypothetical protein
MNKIAILLRKSENPNRFREIILACFKDPAFDDLLLCSGFFQERGKYSASACFAASSSGLSRNKSMTLVGVYNGLWSPDFKLFADKLSAIHTPAGVSVTVTRRRARRFRWHAKVFVANDGLDPKVAVIGSSNMTVRAFGLRSDWNYEADVVIWDDKHKAANTLVSEVLQNDGDVGRASIIVSDYATSDKLNSGMGLKEKVESLVEEVLETSDPE